MSDPKLRIGAVEPELASEFAGLALHWVELDAGSGRSPHELRTRLKDMSNRLSGPQAVQMRQQPIPWAYRVFFRQVGIDPDERRTPIEQLVLDRLQHGGFRSRNLLDDAISVATFETGVAIVAFDADLVEGGLGLRLSRPDEVMGAARRPLASGQIVIADRERALAVLFADLDPGCGVTPRTKRMLVAAVQVEGVPDIAIEEACWTVAEIVTGAA
jgi:DNA/RNA-binding domain of Phe-tRNA-synthetase-like protein